MAEDIKALLKAASKLGVKVSGLPAVRAKLPKTKLGALADELHDVRTVRLALSKIVEAVKAEEQRITDHIIETVSIDEGGVVGKRFKAVIVRENTPVVEDWDALYAHILKKKEFDLLNKALNRAAVKERAENGKAVPGVGSFQTKKLSVTKV